MSIRSTLAVAVALVLAAGPVCAAGGSPAVLERYTFGEDSRTGWRLPKVLREISGLTLAPDGRLFAVNDERAAVYEVDYETGRLVKVFGLGEPLVRGDFEGLAYADGLFWLVTSDGRLYAAAEGADGEHVSYSVFDTDFGRLCEIEGLAYDPRRARLLLGCKEMRGGEGLMILAWDPRTRAADPAGAIRLPLGPVLAALDERRLRPSGIAVDPAGGSLLIVAARERAIVELDANGDFLAAIMLPDKERHRQAEGLEITRDGRLMVADEGGRGRGRLTVYSATNRQHDREQ